MDPRAQSVEDLIGRGLRRAHAEQLGLVEMTPDALEQVFVVDYGPMLRGIRAAAGRHIAPCTAFFRQVGDELRPLGIQLERPDRSAALALPDGSPGWMLAKMHFQSADILIHEVVSHFQWTHAVGEAFALCTARELPWAHPLRRLLAPHQRSTLQQNANALPIVVGEGGLFDRLFAGGTTRGHLLGWGASAWTWTELDLPAQLAARQVDHLVDYPCRDDMLLVWHALRRYVGAFVHATYTGDAAMLADPELQAWLKALRESTGPGMPTVAAREDLVDVVHAGVFLTVKHSLVNSLQFDVYGFPPAAPAAMRVGVPGSLASVTEAQLLEALPDVGESLSAIRATWGFSQHYEPMAMHLERWLPAWAWPLAEQLRTDLRDVEWTIGQRNRARATPYVVALPSRLSNSIDACAGGLGLRSTPTGRSRRGPVRSGLLASDPRRAPSAPRRTAGRRAPGANPRRSRTPPRGSVAGPGRCRRL